MNAGSLRVAFAGTPGFAREALQHMLDAGVNVPQVLTQPDRPAGRGMKPQASPVKLLALQHGLGLAQPRGLKLDGKFAGDAAAARSALEQARPDVLVVAAYGLILPPWLLSLPRHGCLNIHGSLLPRWRGAAPVQRAIEAGDTRTGITLMQMDAGLDTGDMLGQQELPIADDDTGASLTDKLATLGARMVVQALQALETAAGASLPRQPQPEAGVSYAHKIGKAEAAINWREPAATLERRLRAFDPFPGASFVYRGETVKLWRGRVVPAPPGALPGQVLAADSRQLCVACGEHALQLLQLQRPGGRRLAVSQFMRCGTAIEAGARLA